MPASSAASHTPRRRFVDTLHGLFKWAVKALYVHFRPDGWPRAVAKPKTKGFPVWTEEELDQYEARWPIGTRERVMFAVYCFTGLRRGDAARLGRQHIRNGVITIDTEKTGTRVTIPVLPELAEIIAAGPIGELSIIASKSGQPLRKEVIGTLFKTACRAASIDGKSAHGIRKAAATRAANNGATVATLEAIFGWEGGKMAALYTRAAGEGSELAAEHMGKLSSRNREHLFPHLVGRCGPQRKKTNENNCLFQRWWGSSCRINDEYQSLTEKVRELRPIDNEKHYSASPAPSQDRSPMVNRIFKVIETTAGDTCAVFGTDQRNLAINLADSLGARAKSGGALHRGVRRRGVNERRRPRDHCMPETHGLALLWVGRHHRP